MTKATGKRAAQRRREELFSAELTLSRVHAHLANAFARSYRHGPEIDAHGYYQAMRLIIALRNANDEEAKALGMRSEFRSMRERAS